MYAQLMQMCIRDRLHVGRRHAQAGIEPRPQRHDAGNGQEAPERMGDRTREVLVERASHARPRVPSVVIVLPLQHVGGKGAVVALDARHASLADMDDAVGDVGERRVVSDEHDRLARGMTRVLQKLQDGLAGLVVQGPRGLVGEQQLGVLRERAGEMCIRDSACSRAGAKASLACLAASMRAS